MSWNIRKRTPDSFQNPVGYYQRCGETYINDVVNLNTLRSTERQGCNPFRAD